jgi:hypothetical protein
MESEPGSAVDAAPHGQALAQRNGGRGGEIGCEHLGSEHRDDAVVGNVELRGPSWLEADEEAFCHLVRVARPQGADVGEAGDRLPRVGGLAQVSDEVIPPNGADWIARIEFAEWIAAAR